MVTPQLFTLPVSARFQSLRCSVVAEFSPRRRLNRTPQRRDEAQSDAVGRARLSPARRSGIKGHRGELAPRILTLARTAVRERFEREFAAVDVDEDHLDAVGGLAEQIISGRILLVDDAALKRVLK